MKTKKMFVGLGTMAVLGAAIVPMASYAVTDSDSANVDIALKVGSTISMALDGNKIEPSILTSESSDNQTTVATVTTNSSVGYTLSAQTSSLDGSLIGDGNSSNVLPYLGSNYSSSTDAGWALAIGSSYKDISGNKISLVSNGSALANNESTTVGYHFKTTSATAPDTYKTVLTYTASAK
ncbi:hypothetical protein IKG48_00670 [Candidatus Saccharibacteria bacterium]|nr:hypothetical protein [Candidatus Saccharibacteria bacterium]